MRDIVAVSALAAAVIAGPVGAFLVFGTGWALIVACPLLLIVALLAGWS